MHTQNVFKRRVLFLECNIERMIFSLNLENYSKSLFQHAQNSFIKTYLLLTKKQKKEIKRLRKEFTKLCTSNYRNGGIFDFKLLAFVFLPHVIKLLCAKRI